jgi:hypothetical protein
MLVFIRRESTNKTGHRRRLLRGLSLAVVLSVSVYIFLAVPGFQPTDNSNANSNANSNSNSNSTPLLRLGEKKQKAGKTTEMLQKAVKQPTQGMCTSNPYATSLIGETSLSSIHAKAQEWRRNKDSIVEEVDKETKGARTHARFVKTLPQLGECQEDCVGGECEQDGTKRICGLNKGTQDPDCIIYSIGR